MIELLDKLAHPTRFMAVSIGFKLSSLEAVHMFWGSACVLNKVVEE